MYKGPTIAAIATPPGQGAIAVIRVSGENAIQVCEKIFQPAIAGPRLSKHPPNTIHYGKILENGATLDNVLVSIFRAPRSYTGEDIIEISCHGSVFIQQQIIQLLVRNGVAAARPGEFTQRAFLNGKMDLSQAEAVADLIASESAAFHKVAMNQMRGGFSSEIGVLRKQLLNFISLIELELDFSEEDVEFASRSDLKVLLDNISRLISSLTGSFAFGNALKNGIPVVIAGKPNTGKSTLLNALLMEEKAIVSEIPGTTRDSIEDLIHIEGITFRFIDTAGIRETTDTIEILGIQRTMDKIRNAEIILLMAEVTDSRDQINHLLNGIRSTPEFSGKKIILLLNKSDLKAADKKTGNSSQSERSGNPLVDNSYSGDSFQKNGPSETEDFPYADLTPSAGGNDHVMEISAKTGTGIDNLRNLLVSIVQQGKPTDTDVVVTNIRHYHALKNAHEAILRASAGLEHHITGDLLAMDIREVLYYLGEITGEITTDEILGNIFKNFCIGK
ncbi:MAG: tRNA uridine-5-carboxymethylaminomethyl(34) synthesis GTPase MnmE [Bacteroidales bacterium]